MKTSLKLLVYISLICLGLQTVAEAKPITTTTNRNYIQGRGNTRTYIRQDWPGRQGGYYYEQRTIIRNGGYPNYDCDRQPYTHHNDRYNNRHYGGYNQHYPSGNYSNYPQYYPNQNPPYYPQYSVPVIRY